MYIGIDNQQAMPELPSTHWKPNWMQDSPEQRAAAIIVNASVTEGIWLGVSLQQFYVLSRHFHGDWRPDDLIKASRRLIEDGKMVEFDLGMLRYVTLAPDYAKEILA